MELEAGNRANMGKTLMLRKDVLGLTALLVLTEGEPNFYLAYSRVGFGDELRRHGPAERDRVGRRSTHQRQPGSQLVGRYVASGSLRIGFRIWKYPANVATFGSRNSEIFAEPPSSSRLVADHKTHASIHHSGLERRDFSMLTGS